jgi:hypothetical protein
VTSSSLITLSPPEQVILDDATVASDRDRDA